MTRKTLEFLSGFLQQFRAELAIPVADFGGNKKIGSNFVKILLKDNGIDKKHYEILDYTTGYDLLKPIKGKKYGLGICMDLLEHVSQPFIVVKNIKDALKPGALIFVTVPFVWDVHEYPEDYWRFTPAGLTELFSGFECISAFLVSDVANDFVVPTDKEKEADLVWLRERVVAVYRKPLTKR